MESKDKILDKIKKLLKLQIVGQCYKFQNLLIACKRAVDAGRSPENGWNIVDDLGITYEGEDWNLLATL